jgi:hypothetical protein
MDGFVYIPGNESEIPSPLARYLPPVPEGIGAAFLARHPAPGGWVLDPFGTSPSLAIEMARTGWQVLVAVNNPVTRFLLELAADPPSRAELQSALADLAAIRKGDERLETHLQSLYLTECNKCQRSIPAQAFIWERGGTMPVARIYTCPCGESGEFSVTESDQIRSARMAASDRLHRARALERIAAPGDPDRQHAEAALDCYLPRAVYALINIVNKLDGWFLPPARRRAILALVLSACDEASSLWPHPTERPRPKQLAVPPRFLEKNVWMALERSVELWPGLGSPVPVTIWPKVPAEAGGVCLFEGPLRNLAPYLKDIPVAAVVTALPRPNQAFWTLSALWTGWLWERDAAAAFKSVLRRRRYDWNWQAAALYAALKNLSERLPLNMQFFAIVPELEPAFLSAALLAAAGAGFDLNGLALRTRHDPAQILWHRRAFSLEQKDAVEIDTTAVKQAMLTTLSERGEPVSYLHLHAAGLTAMAADHSLRWRPDALTQINAPLQLALTGPEFCHYSESQNPEIGLWGLTGWESAAEPLPDRVEMAIVRFLQKNPGCTIRNIETALNTEFTGLQTPSLGLVQVVLDSYALQTDGVWTLRPEDSPSARRADLESAIQSLSLLAPRLGFSLQREQSPQRLILWKRSGQTAYAFYLLASAVCGNILRAADQTPPQLSLLILPGGRASLLAYKLARDPALRSCAEGWRMIKFRHLRRLTEMTGLTPARFEAELSGDPIEPPEQMKLF